MTARVMLTTSFWLRSAREALYALAALPLGVLWFTTVVTLLALSAGLAITLVGVPLLLLTLGLVRVAAGLERRWAELVLGEHITSSAARPGLQGPDPWWRRLWAVVSEGAVWRETLYLLLQLPAGVALFAAAVTVWSVALGGLTAPAWHWAIPQSELLWEDGGALGRAVELGGTFVLGAIALVAAPWIVHVLVRGHGVLRRALLGPTRGELERAAARSEAGRSAAVASAVADRQRIERDLHDGAQARLVGLAVDLGRARERLEAGGDPTEAVELVRAAHEEAKVALAEVRDLARGIHPAILADRGLDPALSSLAARVPVPVDVSVRLHEPAPVEVEAAAYFVVSESLANAARHANASRVTVDVAREGDAVVVEVRDDGRGGASVSAGSGLAGLRERVAALDGVLVVDSPAGGPTVVKAVIPCA
jgi:signal transduction histidine kinase